jgi:hypothetical protein
VTHTFEGASQLILHRDSGHVSYCQVGMNQLVKANLRDIVVTGDPDSTRRCQT